MQNSTAQQIQVTVTNSLPQLKIILIAPYSLYCNIYRICSEEANYIVKVFPTQKASNYQKQKHILSQLNHPYIIKPIDFQNPLINKAVNTFKSQFIIFPEATRGSLFQYVQTNGSLSQHVVRYYTIQIVEGLAFAHSKGIIHPNLLSQNILIEQNHKILIAGWSNSIGNVYHKLQDLLFAIGQLIISLCISRRPFISKDSKNDPFAKFISNQFIHKFWEQLEKIMKKVNKKFKFTNQLKDLVSNLFLGKIYNFDQILESQWLKIPVNEQEVFAQLQKKEKQGLILKENIKNKVANVYKQQKQLINGKLIFNLQRKPSRLYEIFEQEYSNISQASFIIEQKLKNHQLPYFILFDNDPKMVITHLRTRLRQVIRDKQDIIDVLLILKDFQISLQQGMIKISLEFGWDYESLQEKISICGYSYSINISLWKQQNSLIGQLKLNQQIQLNIQAINKVNCWIISNITQI